MAPDALHIRLARYQRHMIATPQFSQFTNFLYGDDALVHIALRQQRLEQGGLAHACSAGNQHCGMSAHQSHEHRQPSSREYT